MKRPLTAVYPGHPVRLAWIITQEFGSWDEATQNTAPDRTPWSDALTSDRVPGAGGNVHAALDFLKRVMEFGWDKAKSHADEYWLHSSILAPNLQQGQAEADEVSRQEIEEWLP